MTAVDRRGRPKYWLIAMALRDLIGSGEYPPGARLPGENEVMRDHAVARATARQALAQLVSWGLAEARKGSGIYVRDFRPVVRDGIARLGSTTWPSSVSVWETETEGRSLVVDQVEVTQTGAPERIRQLLSLPDGVEVVLRSRRYVLDGKPVLLSRSWLPGRIASGTQIAQPDPGPGGIYARLAKGRPRPSEVPRGPPGPDAGARGDGSPGDRPGDAGRGHLPHRP